MYFVPGLVGELLVRSFVRRQRVASYSAEANSTLPLPPWANDYSIDSIKKNGMDFLKELGRQNMAVGSPSSFPLSSPFNSLLPNHTGSHQIDPLERIAPHLLHAHVVRDVPFCCPPRLCLFVGLCREGVEGGGRDGEEVGG